MSRVSSYPDYRSGSDRWFPPAPTHWIDSPLWTIFTRTALKGHGDETLLSVYRDHGVVPKDSRDDNFNRASEDLSAYQLVEPHDLVINKMKAWQGSLSISQHRGIVSPAYFVYRPHHGSDERFLHHLLRSQPLVAAYIGMSKGVRIGQWDLEPQNFSRLKLALPPLPEQQAIADYLDRETAQIDTLIEEQQRLVEMLRERRLAVVDNVITRGLDPNTRNANSCAPWIGEIPAHWTIRPLWTMFERIKDTGHPDEQMLSVFRDYGVVAKESRGNLNQTAENRNIYQLVHPGWLVTNRMKAWQGSVGISPLRGITSGHYICFAPRHGEDSNFLNWLFRSPRYAVGYGLISRGVRIGQAEIDNDDYRVMPVILPPLDEQRRIVAYLDAQTEKIDSLIAETERFIELSRERRSALITAAVTGQIDVREQVA